MRWPWSSRNRLRESKRKIAEHERALAELKEQRPKVVQLAHYAQGQIRQNHLSELVAQIPPRRH